MKKVLLLITLLNFYLISFNQTIDQGKVTYSIVASGGDAEMASMMKDAKMTNYFKDGNVRVDLTFSMGTTSTIIKNGDTQATILMDMMGQKNMMKVDLDQASNDNATYTVTETTETKTIAGYECKKAIIKSSKGESYTCWYTTQMANIPSKYKMLDNIKGFPLEYEVADNGMTLKMTALSVSTTGVDSSVFTIPSGYNEVQMPNMGNH